MFILTAAGSARPKKTNKTHNPIKPDKTQKTHLGWAF